MKKEKDKPQEGEPSKIQDGSTILRRIDPQTGTLVGTIVRIGGVK